MGEFRFRWQGPTKRVGREIPYTGSGEEPHVSRRKNHTQVVEKGHTEVVEKNHAEVVEKDPYLTESGERRMIYL